MSNFSELDYTAEKLGCVVAENAPLSEYTSFRIGGGAARLIEVPSKEAAATVASLAVQTGKSVVWLGKGSNVLAADEGFDGVVLRLSEQGVPTVCGNRLVGSAGLPLVRLCRVAQQHHLSGLEFAYGIPGSIGGAVYMNAGAYGGEIKNVLKQVTVLCPDGTLAVRQTEELELGYRHSALMNSGEVVLSAEFELSPGRPEEIEGKMEELMARRREKQPLEYPSAGSFFKRPAGQFAGALIEKCGLKGFRVGDAQVSEKHAGFVVNRGHATAGEVKRLAREVRRRVQAETGFDLVPEVRLLSGSWDD